MNSGPSVSGNPWPRFTDPVASASADISAKIVVVADLTRSAFHCETTPTLLRSAGTCSALRVREPSRRLQRRTRWW